jgi:hypothetical protein
MATAGGLKTIRAYLSQQDLERLKATSGDPKPNLSDLTRQAIKFWCDALEHINGDDHSPVRLCGVKVRFERKVPRPKTEYVDTRDPECVRQWPECFDGGYDPHCCRFPKSCSCGGD